MRLTTAQVLVRYLSAQMTERDGRQQRLVPRMLGIFGHGNVAGIGQALDECHDVMPYVQGRNEQSLVHMASGYARASRRVATLAVTSSIGPGATNMVTGAALATVNRLPVLLLPAESHVTRRQGPVLQQLEHPMSGDVSVNDCFRPVSRYFDRITRPEQLLTALPEAMRVLTSPVEAGAVVLALPQDVQCESFECPADFLARRVWRIGRPVPQPFQIAAVTELLGQATRPLIIAGGGVIYSEAEDALASFAEEFGVPVVETFAGKGAVKRDAWWGGGGLGLEGNQAANTLAKEADLVLHVGTRLTDFATASQSLFQHPAVRFASVNVSDHDAQKQGATPVLADARLALEALAESSRRAGIRPIPGWERRTRALKDDWRRQRARALAPGETLPITQGQLIGLLQETAEAGDTVIAAAGGPPGDLLKTWDATEGRNCHLEFGFSCMGYEIPASLGVRMAQRTGEVIALIGDGTFLMQPTEILTASQEGLRVTIVVADNHGFQVIGRLQRLCAARQFGTEFRYREDDQGSGGLSGEYLRVDIAAIAAGLDAEVHTASTPAEVRAALRLARESTRPVVLVVPTAPFVDLPSSGAWWDVAPAEVSGQPDVSQRRSEYLKGRALQRWYG